MKNLALTLLLASMFLSSGCIFAVKTETPASKAGCTNPCCQRAGKGGSAIYVGVPEKELRETKARRWKCGDYVEVLDPSGGVPSTPRSWRICGPWLECPTFTETSDGAKWQFLGNCADAP